MTKPAQEDIILSAPDLSNRKVNAMFIELEPIFNNIGMSAPFDYELDMSDEEFWASKPFQKAVRVKGEAVNRARHSLHRSSGDG